MLLWRKSLLFIKLFALLCISEKNEDVKIMNCKFRKLTLYEDAPEPITCSRLTKNGTNIWRHYGDNKIIGECSAEGNCTNYFNSTNRLNRDPFSDESRLTIISNFRDFNSDRIACEDKESKTGDSCVLIIKHHPVLSDCQVHVKSTGNVSGSCFADKMFSSDGLYSCDWEMTGPGGNIKQISPSSFGNTKTCRRDYCWGTCSFSQPLPKEKGVYNYTIIVLDSAKGTFSQEVIIGSRGGNAQNETTNGNEGERTSKKSDSSTSSPGQAAGNGSKSGGSTPRSSSSGSDKPSTNPNYTSTALQEVEIHAYMDLHTRDPTYASTTSSKDPHTYMELKTLRAQSDPQQPGGERNGNDGYETPQMPGRGNQSSDGYETPQPPREGRRRSALYANQGISGEAIQEEVDYYNEA